MGRGVQPPSPLVSALPVVSFEKIEDSSNKPHGVHDLATRSFGYNAYDLPPFVRPAGYMHYLEPLESDLAKQVEYDMDEQDKEWLDSVNAERKKENSNSVSCETFEIIMDRLEKEWFDLTKNLAKTDFAMPSEDSTCAICDDSEGENSNAIVFCDGCNLAVHQDCYGVPYIPEGQWLCRKCTASPETPVSCVLCPNEGGAFKQTQQNDWVHLLCAIWIPETSALNPAFMEPIIGVEAINKARWKLRCTICNIKHGACIQCNKTQCVQAFHPTCARKDKLLLPMKSVEGGKLAAYCERHLPEEQREIRAASLAAEEASEEYDGMQSKSARAYAKTYKPAPPLVPALILERILYYVQRINIRKKPEFVAMVCRYWSLKREARRGAPLLKRLHLEPWTANAASKVQTEEEKQTKLEYLQKLRADLVKARQLVKLTLRREQKKAEQAHLIRDVLNQSLFSRELALHDAFKEITDMDRNEYFKNPVSKAEVPDYFDVIQRPMCWNTIEEKLARREYWDVQTFKDDVQLVIDNAILYNKNGTTFNKAARRIQERAVPIFERLTLLASGPPETEPPPTPTPPPPPPPSHEDPSHQQPDPPVDPQPEVYPSVQRVVLRLNLPTSPLQPKQPEPPADVPPPERSEPLAYAPLPERSEPPTDAPPPGQSEPLNEAPPPEQSEPPTDFQPKTSSSDPQPEVPPEPFEELLPQKIEEESDTHPLLPPVGDLEPPLDILNLLLRPDAIEPDLSYELPTDPISFLFAFDLGVEKVKPEAAVALLPPPPSVPAKPPRVRKKRDRAAENAARRLKRSAEKAAARARAEAAASAGVASTSARTSDTISSSTTSRPKPQSEYPAVVEADGLDKRITFALFESGWILPPETKRNGRKAPPPVPVTVSASVASTSSVSGSHNKKKERKGRTSSLSRSTAPSENPILPDEGMDVDPPSASASGSGSFPHPATYGTRRQSRLEAGLTVADRGGGGTIEPPEAAFPRLVREHGRAIIEEIESPASRREKAKKRKERRISELTGASEPEPEPEAEPEPEPGAHAGTEGDSVSVAAVEVEASGDVEMGYEESELSEVPDEVMEAPPPPPEVETPPAQTTQVQTQPEPEPHTAMETEPLDMVPLMVIPRPPYEPLPRKYSTTEFKKLQNRSGGTAEAVAMLARGRMKESEAVPDTLVWVKGTSFPWFPSVIVSKHDFMLIPHEVQKIGREARNRDKYLIKYYDKEGSWQYVPLHNMVKMFEDEILDQDLLAEDSAVQRWKKPVWLDQTREAYAYAKQQWEQPEPENGDEMPLG